MSVPDASPQPDTQPVELEGEELSALLGALRLEALTSRAAIDGADELERRRLSRQGDVADGLRRIVARACGPIAATATLWLTDENRQALVAVLERLDDQITAGHPWARTWTVQHPVVPAEVVERLTQREPLPW